MKVICLKYFSKIVRKREIKQTEKGNEKSKLSKNWHQADH